jgi:hypothetical protein
MQIRCQNSLNDREAGDNDKIFISVFGVSLVYMLCAWVAPLLRFSQ